MDILILYSEYSKRCKSFMERLEGDSVLDSNKLNKLCIDCPSVRKAILTQENIVIKKVPTVLVKSKDMIDAYEGKVAFDWLQSFSNQLYDQLSKQQEEAELLAIQKEEEIESRIRQEAEAIAEQKIQTIKQSSPPPPQQQEKKTLKQQARRIEQDRTTSISFDNQPRTEMGEVHVTHVKSEISGNPKDFAAKMERERNAEIQKLMPPPDNYSHATIP